MYFLRFPAGISNAAFSRPVGSIGWQKFINRCAISVRLGGEYLVQRLHRDRTDAGFLFADTQTHDMKLISEAGEVFQDIMSAPDRGVPQDILAKAQCVGIIPNLKKAGVLDFKSAPAKRMQCWWCRTGMEKRN